MSGGKSALGLDANVASLLCYLPICGISLIMSIIVLVTDKDNRTVRFHAFQSLLILAAVIVLWIALVVFGLVVAMAQSAILGLLLLLVEIVFIVALLGLMIFCMIKAYQGQIFKLPVIGDMAEKWANA